jgi:hypothetical protein
MKALRQIDVREATAAVLPGYELKFYGSSNSNAISSMFSKQLFETSAAYVQPVKDAENSPLLVHGVLYTLSDKDFAKVGRTEGVPFAYRWQRCEVCPYIGDGESAGYEALQDTRLQLEAYTLVPPNPQHMTEALPSASYLGLIRQGAELWKFDRAYREQLDNVQVASNLLVSDGISELALRWAERAAGIDRTYKIGVGGRKVWT